MEDCMYCRIKYCATIEKDTLVVVIIKIIIFSIVL